MTPTRAAWLPKPWNDLLGVLHGNPMLLQPPRPCSAPPGLPMGGFNGPGPRDLLDWMDAMVSWDMARICWIGGVPLRPNWMWDNAG